MSHFLMCDTFCVSVSIFGSCVVLLLGECAVLRISSPGHWTQAAIRKFSIYLKKRSAHGMVSRTRTVVSRIFSLLSSITEFHPVSSARDLIAVGKINSQDHPSSWHCKIGGHMTSRDQRPLSQVTGGGFRKVITTPLWGFRNRTAHSRWTRTGVMW